MRNTEEALTTAIGELRCISPSDAATIDELTALNAAREAINEMIRSCVAELRADPRGTPAWSEIARALGSSSASAVRQRFGLDENAEHAAANDRLISFWAEHAEQFTWDFLPIGFIHDLYVQWLSVRYPVDAALSEQAFTRRLLKVATSTGQWTHSRSRPGSMMNADEPLVHKLTHWTNDGSNRAVYGFRRNKNSS